MTKTLKMYGLTLQRHSVYIPTTAQARRVLKVTIPLGAFAYGTIRPSGCEELKVYIVRWWVMYPVKCVCVLAISLKESENANNPLLP